MSTRMFYIQDDNTLLVPGSIARSVAVGLKKIEVVSRTASDHWIMAFAGTARPANGTAPLFVPTIVQANYVGLADYYEARKIPTPGLVLALSTTPETLTAPAGDDFDITAEVEEWELQPEGTSVAGDLTTDVAALAVWTDASGPKHLISVEAKNNGAGATRYLQVHTVDAPAEGVVPLRSFEVEDNAVLYQHFGRDGWSPLRLTTAFVTQDGCRLVWSSTQWTKTAVAAMGPVKAVYK